MATHTVTRALLASIWVAAVVLATACSRSGEHFEGQWKSANIIMTITRAGDGFIVACDNPAGVLNGQFAGSFIDAGLKVNAGVAGEQLITYAKADDTLAFAGERFIRISTDPSDGIWVDDSGLTWTLKDNGKKVRYPGARDHCASLRLGGWSDWRLPSIEELQRVQRQPVRPLTVTAPVLWSGTIRTSQNRAAGEFIEVLNFSNGAGFGVGTIDETHTGTCFCVRP